MFFFRLTDRFNNDFVFNIDGIIVDATGETTQGSLAILSLTMQDTYIALPQIDIFNLSPFDGLKHRIPISTYGVFPHSSSFISTACTTSLPNIIMTLESQAISCDIIFTPSHIEGGVGQITANHASYDIRVWYLTLLFFFPQFKTKEWV